jgi:general L-amino acid transport system substrate-binding protein
MKTNILPWLVAAALGVAATAAQADTLADVKAKGFLQCGANTGLLGFGSPDDKGEWKGFDVDFCRAIAVAIFNDPTKVKFTPLTAKERFTALQSGEVDVLVRNTTWTLSRDSQMGLIFAGVNYYDGQGFMVRKSLGISSALELSGASVCVQTGTTTELNLADYFRANGMQFNPVVFEKSDEVVQAYDAGRCDAFTTDASGLYAERLKLTNPADHMVLPEIISKEPLGPVVRQGDDKWLDHREVDALRDAERRGSRRDVGQRRPDEDLRQPGHQAPARHRGRLRRADRPRQRLGGQRHQVRRQLRRSPSTATSARTPRSASPAA